MKQLANGEVQPTVITSCYIENRLIFIPFGFIYWRERPNDTSFCEALNEKDNRFETGTVFLCVVWSEIKKSIFDSMKRKMCVNSICWKRREKKTNFRCRLFRKMATPNSELFVFNGRKLTNDYLNALYTMLCIKWTFNEESYSFDFVWKLCFHGNSLRLCS